MVDYIVCTFEEIFMELLFLRDTIASRHQPIKTRKGVAFSVQLSGNPPFSFKKAAYHVFVYFVGTKIWGHPAVVYSTPTDVTIPRHITSNDVTIPFLHSKACEPNRLTVFYCYIENVNLSVS